MLIVCLLGGGISSFIDYILVQRYHKGQNIENIGTVTSAITYSGMFFLFAHISFLFLIAVLFIYLNAQKKISLILLSIIGLFLGAFIGYLIGDFFSFYIYPEKQYKNVIVFGLMLFVFPYISSAMYKFENGTKQP